MFGSLHDFAGFRNTIQGEPSGTEITATACWRSLRNSTSEILVSCTGVAPVTRIRPLGVAVHAQARSSAPARSFTHKDNVPFKGMLWPSRASSVPQFFLTSPTVTWSPLLASTEKLASGLGGWFSSGAATKPTARQATATAPTTADQRRRDFRRRTASPSSKVGGTARESWISLSGERCQVRATASGTGSASSSEGRLLRSSSSLRHSAQTFRCS